MLQNVNTEILNFSPVEKLVEGDSALYPHPPYVPCSGSPAPGGGTWSSSVPAPGHPGHPAYMGPGPGAGGQPSPAAGGQHNNTSQGQGPGSGGQSGAPLPSPLYPWMRSQFGNGNINSITLLFLFISLFFITHPSNNHNFLIFFGFTLIFTL